jgi:hypothetical protein
MTFHHPISKAFALLLSLFLSSISPFASSEIVDQGSYVTDTDTGLDWLKVTATTGLSYDDVSSSMDEGEQFYGWRYATGSNFNTLLNNVGGTPDCPPNYCDVSEINNGVFRPLIDLLGDTDPDSRGVTYGILGDPGPVDGTYWRAIIDDLYEEPPDVSMADWAQTNYRFIDSSSSAPYLGSFLVRPGQSSPPRAIPIFNPIGLMATIFGISLIALVRIGQSRKNK